MKFFLSFLSVIILTTVSNNALCGDKVTTLVKGTNKIFLIGSGHSVVRGLTTAHLEDATFAIKQSDTVLIEKTEIDIATIKQDIVGSKKLEKNKLPVECLKKLSYWNSASLYPSEYWTQFRLSLVAWQEAGKILAEGTSRNDYVSINPDQFLFQKIKELGISWSRIESADQAIAILRSIKTEDSTNIINRICLVRESPVLSNQIRVLNVAMRNAFLKSEFLELFELNISFTKEMLDAENIYREKILRERNVNFLQAINSKLNSETTISVVVGAAHLAGEDGLIRLLQKDGFIIVHK